MTHGLTPAVSLPGSGEAVAGAEGDVDVIRVEAGGADPITVVEATTSDTEAVPLHSHPWDELFYVLEGEMSLTSGDHTAVGGPGTLGTLPRGEPHTFHVTRAPAKFLLITVGAPSASFFREVAAVFAQGATVERLIEVTRRHNVTLHSDETTGQQ